MIDNVDTADVMTLLTLFESQIENKVSWFLYICSALLLDIFINLESTPISVVEVFVNYKHCKNCKCGPLSQLIVR